MSNVMDRSWRRALPSVGSNRADNMDARTLYALAALIILVQVPHLSTLPLWVSALGCILVIARLVLLKRQENKVLGYALSPISVTLLAGASAFLISWDYGYFIGRDPCVAFLFILVAAKFAEVRRATDATLLLCLCAFLLLTQYFYSQTILSALITLPAVVALAFSLSVLRDANNPESTSRQLRMIGALLLQGLPLAAVLFIVFPRLPGPMWSVPEDAMASTGLSDSMSPGSIGQLSQSDAVAFRVDFDGVVPDKHELYWRGPVLTEFDGRNWGVSPLEFEANPAYTGPRDSLVNYTVTLQAHRQRWLFALDSAASLPQSYNAAQGDEESHTRPVGQMYDDGQILTKESVSQTLRYRQSSFVNSTIPSVGKPRNETLHLPGQNIRTLRFARELRKNYDNDGLFAHGLLQYFNANSFRYTLQPQVLGHTPVDEFLFDTREGFCEHYASAFVVMMRAAGIPARVVTGYQGGEMNEDYMIVRQSSAHAWAEAYINGLWQRFDPTSSVAPSRVDSGLAAALPGEASVPRMARQVPGLLRDMQLRWDALNHQWQRMVIDFDNESQASFWDRVGFGKPSLWQLSVIVIVLAGLWSGLLLGIPRNGGKRLAVQERYWQQLSRLLNAQALKRHHHETPGEYLHRAAMRWPSHQLRWQRMDLAFSCLRFQSPDNHQKQSLLKQLRKDFLFLQIVLPFSRKRQEPPDKLQAPSAKSN